MTSVIDLINLVLLLAAYLISLLPFIILLFIYLFKPKFRARKGLIWTSLSLLPFIFLLISQQYKKRARELEEVGVYQLTSYPDCSNCKLELFKNNTYEVRKDTTVFEEGQWHFESGSDYWITYIGENGQLGSGKYIYVPEYLNEYIN